MIKQWLNILYKGRQIVHSIPMYYKDWCFYLMIDEITWWGKWHGGDAISTSLGQTIHSYNSVIPKLYYPPLLPDIRTIIVKFTDMRTGYFTDP